MRSIVVTALIVVGSTCMADEDAERFVSEVRVRIEEIKKERDELTDQIKAMKTGRVNLNLNGPLAVTDSRGKKRYTWRSREEKEKAIAEANQRLGMLSDPAAAIPKLPLASAFKSGMIGRMPDVHSSQVFVRIGEGGAMTTQCVLYRCIALQVIDDSNVLVRHESQTTSLAGVHPEVQSAIFLLRSPTKGMVDGQGIPVNGVYKVTGTHQYESQTGVRTVFAVEPFDASELVAKAKG